MKKAYSIDWQGGLTTALVVGSTLNLINQWDALFGTAEPSITKIALTYIVPFCVFQYGKYKAS